MGAGSYSHKNLVKDDISFYKGLDACIETEEGYLGTVMRGGLFTGMKTRTHRTYRLENKLLQRSPQLAVLEIVLENKEYKDI